MTNFTMEQRIRVEILPSIQSLADNLWDTGANTQGRKLDKIVNDLVAILDGKENEDN